MKRLESFCAIISLFFLFTSCSPATTGFELPSNEVNFTGAVELNKKVDILFVIDNTSSMLQHQHSTLSWPVPAPSRRAPMPWPSARAAWAWRATTTAPSASSSRPVTARAPARRTCAAPTWRAFSSRPTNCRCLPAMAAARRSSCRRSTRRC